MSNINIRPGTIHDVPIILRFINELAEYEKLAHASVATAEQLGRHLFGERPYAETLIGEFDAEPVGYALYFHSFSTFEGAPGVFLEDLFVTITKRGHGVGKALLQQVAAITAQRGCARLEWAVLDWNEPAINFYRSLGASPLDDWTIYRADGPALQALVGDVG